MSSAPVPLEDNWIPTHWHFPECDKTPNSLGKLVLIWPRSPEGSPDVDGFAYYGCRITDEPNFYLHGRVISGVTHWQDLPEGPVE